MLKAISTGLLAISFALLNLNTSYGQIPATAKEEKFIDWNYSATGVFGLVKLDNIEKRSYYKVFKLNTDAVKVQSYNAAGILTNTLLFRFMNGKINQMTSTDRWGETTDITKYTTGGPNELIVTKKNNGKNSYLPCKGAKFIYRNNQVAEIQYLSFTNKLTTYSSGVSIVRYKRYLDKNRFSLLKEMTFFDVEGKSVISTSYDCHKVIYEYDEQCNMTSIAYYGIDGEPLTNRYGGFKNRYLYNDKGNQVNSEVIGINDEITKNAYGVAINKYEYKNGFTSQATRYDEKNNIVKTTDAGDGIAILKYEYDVNGNQISQSYFDEKNNPMNNHSGYHKITYAYDPLDMLTGSAYYDKYGSPTEDRQGIYKQTYVRDDKGRLIQKAYFNKSNTPVKDDVDEIFMLKYKYDEWGREISESYWENASTKMNRWNGCHENITKYNAEGQEVENILLDQSGNQFVSQSGFSRVLTGYDANARVAEYKYFTNNAPVSLENGLTNNCHMVRFYYDANGRRASLRYFDNQAQFTDALISMGGDIGKFKCHKIEFIYKGSTIVEERIYTVNSESPSKVIDCLKSDYINTNGISMGYKNK